MRIVTILLLAFAIFVNGCAFNTDDNRSTKDVVSPVGTMSDDRTIGIKHLRQLVTEDNSQGRTIMWSAPGSKYTLELRGSEGTEYHEAEDRSFHDDKYQYIQYGVTLENLIPNSEYMYRILRGSEKGNWHKLNTGNGKAGFKALIFPDSQCADYRNWREIAQTAYERNRAASFFINMGDMVDNGQQQSQWEQWLFGVEGFSGDIPFAPVIGNHETYALDWNVKLPTAYTNLFYVPTNGMDEYRHQFYSFDYGDVHFTVLDTNYDDELSGFQPKLRQEQLDWLERDLANATAKWKVVLMHRDVFIYGFGPKSGRAHTFSTYFIQVGTDMMPIFERYNVDAVLTAHLHTYRRRVPLRNFKPANNGITYILTGVAGDVRYENLWENFAWDAARAPQPETSNYMTLECRDNTLTFSAFLPDGRQFDTVTLTK